MSRPLRLFESGAIYHLIPTFVGGEWFIRSPEERAMYLKLLGQGLAGSSWRCMAYAVMSNHIHLAMLAGRGNVASWIREPHAEFADWINLRYGRKRRKGAVFVRGPKEYRIAPDSVARLIGYLHRNPVRAGVVEDPRETDWTSHRAYVGDMPRPRWLDTQLGLELGGFRDVNTLDTWIRETNLDREQMLATVYPRTRRTGRPEWGRPPAPDRPTARSRRGRRRR